MALLKCTKCGASFEQEINGVPYCPMCTEIVPLPPLDEEEKESVYLDAIRIFERAKDPSNIEDVIGIFIQLDGYASSNYYIDKCNKKIEELKNDKIYAEALQKMELETIRGYKQAIELFEQIPDYKSASFKLDEARAKLEAMQELLQKRRDKIAKISMIVCACLIVLAIGAYLIIEFAVPAIKYSVALNAIEDSEFDKAYGILEELGDYKDAVTELKKSKYERGVSYAEQGEMASAAKLLSGAIGYNDAEERLHEICKSLTLKEQLAALDIGNSVFLGYYEQDTDSDGTEMIEWIIADKSGDNVLLISKYAIEASAFSAADTVWSKSEIRVWLNNTFITSTIPIADRSSLVLSSISTVNRDGDGNEKIDLSTDYVFLLSANEATRYFETNDLRAAMAVKALEGKGAHINEANGCAHYWLRSSTADGEIMYVNGSGAINEGGKSADSVMALRPAMWVSSK